MPCWLGRGGARRIVGAACSSDGQDGDTFTTPSPSDESAGGLNVEFIPDGFSWVWNEGHETATFYVFQTQDGSQQLSIGIQIGPPPHPGAGEVITRGDHEFTVYDEGTQIRVTENLGTDTRLDVVSDSLDAETLLRVAESVAYEPDADD